MITKRQFIDYIVLCINNYYDTMLLSDSRKDPKTGGRALQLKRIIYQM